MGRPTTYHLDIANEICRRLVEGKDGEDGDGPESLRAICKDEEMPGKSTVFRWLRDHKEFQDQYARAREAQAEVYADEIIEISDDSKKDWEQREGRGGGYYMAINVEAVMRSKLRVDARKWVLAKALPKKYGDLRRLEHSGPDGGPIAIDATNHEALITQAITYGLVDRLPPALREMAQKRLPPTASPAATPPETAANTREIAPIMGGSAGFQPESGEDRADEAAKDGDCKGQDDEGTGTSEGGDKA